MKKLLVVLMGLILVVAMIIAAGCGGSNKTSKAPISGNPGVISAPTSDTQKNVIGEFYQFINNGDFKKASELTTYPSITLAQLNSRFAGPERFISIQDLNIARIDSNAATFRVSYYVRSNLKNGDCYDYVHLVEVGGLWRIDGIEDSILR